MNIKVAEDMLYNIYDISKYLEITSSPFPRIAGPWPSSWGIVLEKNMVRWWWWCWRGWWLSGCCKLWWKWWEPIVEDGGGKESGYWGWSWSCFRPVVEGCGGEEDGQGGEGSEQDATNHVEVGEVSEDSVFLEVSKDSAFLEVSKDSVFLEVSEDSVF